MPGHEDVHVPGGDSAEEVADEAAHGVDVGAEELHEESLVWEFSLEGFHGTLIINDFRGHRKICYLRGMRITIVSSSRLLVPNKERFLPFGEKGVLCELVAIQSAEEDLAARVTGSRGAMIMGKGA
jgi:hypothetical protein